MTNFPLWSGAQGVTVISKSCLILDIAYIIGLLMQPPNITLRRNLGWNLCWRVFLELVIKNICLACAKEVFFGACAKEVMLGILLLQQLCRFNWEAAIRGPLKIKLRGWCYNMSLDEPALQYPITMLGNNTWGIFWELHRWWFNVLQ